MQNTMTDLDKYRARKDNFFKEHPGSPLTPQHQAEFTGLRYFPEDETLRLEVAVERDSNRELVYFDTTGDTLQPYTRVGRFKFKVDEEIAELTIFASDQGYFLPFVDAQAGKETYLAGRYLEPEPLDEHYFYIDFNLAYNPYCAYNEQWTCPLTPAENHLKIEIRAGERLFIGQ